ncbi:CPBP family intramembrane glutamic endopeptidase [Sutcliffiella deserti]|uniref:CPBP family intramembrane glutamic endopeptidase n=1 Tax=Sutcliffiella deserti TaxID=2875501 RepID=UPI001CBCD276|nr:CPBP family intramembrane glutamic endopeptidase [Sutcliffiella deserti]
MKNKQAELVKNMSDKELSTHLYLSQLIFLAIAVGLGLFFFEDMEHFNRIWSWDVKDIFLVGTMVGIAVVGLDLLLLKYLPKHFMDDGGINERLFRTKSVAHIVFLAMLIAVVEELLFRGVVQTHFGIWVASLVFALLHIRYLHKWLLLVSVILLSFLLGYIYEVTGNIFVTIWAHFIIDVLLALKIRLDFVKSRDIEIDEGNEQKDE